MVGLLLLVVAMTSAIVTMHFAIHGAEVQVPNLRGMTVAEAGRRAGAMGLRLHVETRLYSAEVPEGRVSNQSPRAGTIVRRGWRVWLTESLGPQKKTIPNVVGESERLAAIEIRRAGLETGSMAEMPWPDADAGTVIAQSPQAHATDASQPVVNLLVASEAGPQAQNGLVMPDVVGEMLTAAAQRLRGAGLQVAPVKEQETGAGEPAARAGTVIAQEPAAGYYVDATMPVTLTVAK